MKFSIILLFSALFQLSAISLAQKVTIDKTEISYKSLFKEIENQTGLITIYNNSQIDMDQIVKVTSSETELGDLYNEVLKNKGLTFEIVKDYIVIKKAPIVKTELSSIMQDPIAKNIDIAGIVLDESKEPIPGVAVYVVGNSLLGSITDYDGNFILKNVPKKSLVTVRSIAFDNYDIEVDNYKYEDLKKLVIILKSSNSKLDEVVVTGHGSQKKESVIGAISTVKPKELITPTRSLSTQLAGKVSGVIFSQNSGEPGKDNASFVIRGINSVIGSSSPLVLIDGLKRSLDDIDPNDVESFSVLKDASATAVYGLEGANGVIVITTKAGEAGAKPAVRVSYSQSLNNSTYTPDWIDSPKYAQMVNEALAGRGKRVRYTDKQIGLFGDDNNDMYPNVDWHDILYKNNNLASKANFNISGGGNVVTYYMSGGFYREEGMFKADLEQYDANANYNEFSFRSNLKADLTRYTTIGMGFDGRYSVKAEPGQGTDHILGLAAIINPLNIPHQYSNGESPVEPTAIGNPYAQLNKTGFRRHYNNTMNTNVNLTQKLDFITKGLYMTGVASFRKTSWYSHYYAKKYRQHEINLMDSPLGDGYDEDGNLMTVNSVKTENIDTKMVFDAGNTGGNRSVELHGTLNYARTWDKISTTALVLYKQRESLADMPGGDGAAKLINALPARTQSIASRMTGAYDNKYFLDVSYGFSGSQMFTPDKRWSSFPSFGAGWIVSKENFFEGITPVVDFLKLRVSYGIVGSSGRAQRFGYLASTAGVGGHNFGFSDDAYTNNYIGGVAEQRLEQLGLTWDENKKLDLGVEFSLFNSFRVILDYYENKRVNQLIPLERLPSTLGLAEVPLTNMGGFDSKGLDIDFTYSKAWKNFQINYIKGVVGINENTIKEDGNFNPKVPYHSAIGYDWGRAQAYISEGYFKDEDDIATSAIQSWNEVRPGDLKYKDINGDGIINSEDKIWVGPIYPKVTYSLSFDLSYKKWTFATRMVGKAGMFRHLDSSRIPFSLGENGAIYADAWEDHWTPESYSGDKATENPNAKYPRLGFGADNANNQQSSTHWIKDASYLRIADVELGYRYVPKGNSAFKNIYIYSRVDNVHTFSDFKDWNPEQERGSAYPLKQTITIGLSANFKL